MIGELKFDECEDCIFCRVRLGQQVLRGNCAECSSGEFFEPNDEEPSVDEFINNGW